MGGERVYNGRVRRARLLGLPLVVFVCLAACGEGSGELLVRVEPRGDVGAVDQLGVSVHSDDDAVPLVERRIGGLDGPLPQSFLLLSGARTSGATVRIHVDALSGPNIAAAGDALVTIPATGRAETIVGVTAGCAGVSCPRLQSCDSATATCDGACATAAACTSLLGCDATAMCSIAAGAATGSCAGRGADADTDGARDARCAIDPDHTSAAADCDDTSSAARPGAVRTCGAGRDNDCDGVVDELELCASACVGAGAIVVSEQLQVDTGSEVRSVGGLRASGSGYQLFVAGPTQIQAYSIARGVSPVLLSTHGAEDVRQITLAGPLLAAATGRGLVLFSVAQTGELSPLGPPLAVPPGNPQPLLAVTIAESTAWLGGTGFGLAAIDVSNPEGPRFAGFVDGPPAPTVVRAEGGVLAATIDPAHSVLYYPAPPRAAPNPSVDVSSDLEASGTVVTAIAVQPPRAAIEMREIVAIATGGTLRTFERTGSMQYERRDEITGLAILAGLHLDEGTLLYATTSGAAGAVVRGSTAGALSTTRVAEPRGTEEELAGFWATTSVDEQPVAVAGLGTVARIVFFSCAP